MSRRIIEGSYARLVGLKNSTITGTKYLSKDFGDDYLLVLKTLRENVDDEFIGFDFTEGCYFNQHTNDTTYNRSSVV